MMYAKWVERMLQTPLSSTEVRDNMLKQQSNVREQLKLINEQIFLYRVRLMCFCLTIIPVQTLSKSSFFLFIHV